MVSHWTLPSSPSASFSYCRIAHKLIRVPHRMNRRKADFKFVYKYLEDEL